MTYLETVKYLVREIAQEIREEGFVFSEELLIQRIDERLTTK